MIESSRTSQTLWLVCLALALILCSVIVLLSGLSSPFVSAIDRQIMLQIRLPMLLTAMSVGAALSVSSALLQVLLRNPLADPGIIGISSGASLFAAIYLLAGGVWGWTGMQYGLPLFCFIGALLSTLFIYVLARRMAGLNGSSVILAGIGVSTIAGAIIAWLYFFSDAQALRNLTFWLMGSLMQTDLNLISLTSPVVLLLVVYSFSQSRQLNWLYFGQATARLAGLDVGRFNRRILITSALLVGIAVSLAGSIAFVGLLVPHLLRNFCGHDNRFIIPASALGGALLLMLVVILSKSFGGIAVPVSMLTATLGGPVFLYSMSRIGRQAR